MPPCQGGCREFEPRLPLHLKVQFCKFNINFISEGFTLFFKKEFMSERTKVSVIVPIFNTSIFETLYLGGHRPG